ncbi:Gx transporter family protein [Treponema sp. R6D11]
MHTKHIKLAILLGIGVVLQIVDNLFILPINIPGGKLGIANIVTLYAIYTFSAPDAILVSILRASLGSIIFGGTTTLFYSLSGAVLAVLIMLVAKKIKPFSIYGVSLLGSIANNIGQILVACFMLSSFAPIYYLPYLVLLGCLSSLAVAYATVLMLKHKD